MFLPSRPACVYRVCMDFRQSMYEITDFVDEEITVDNYNLRAVVPGDGTEQEYDKEDVR